METKLGAICVNCGKRYTNVPASFLCPECRLEAREIAIQRMEKEPDCIHVSGDSSNIDDLRKQFNENMNKLSKVEDKENRHYYMDELMCNTLSALGFGEGVDIFKSTDMWWA